MNLKPIVRKLMKEQMDPDTIFEDPAIFTSSSDIDIDELPPYQEYTPDDYRDGPEGFIKWCEDRVWIPIYPTGGDIAVWVPIRKLSTDKNPITGRSYRDIWDAQKEVCRRCLRMVDGRFIYRLIVLCWMRGEGKSLLACLIQLWKFFNWPKQQIVLGANSKEQITFVHYDIMRDIILHSPDLLRAIGKRGIREKNITMRDSQGRPDSFIKAISSFSGIVSNITGYTFSEIFDMKNPKFFVQLDGSIRNIPNALGVIDSTVSSKQHILYNLFKGFVDRTSKTLYFSYRFSLKGNAEDYWNPNMTQGQLDDYKVKFPLQDFERYFLNTWGSASARVFTDKMIEGMGYIAYNGKMDNPIDLMNAVEVMVKAKEESEFIKETVLVRREFNQEKLEDLTAVSTKIEKSLVKTDTIYQLKAPFGNVHMATSEDLRHLGDLFDTEWSILCGIDRADPMKGSERGARTIFTCVAKGLPGSRNKPPFFDYGSVPKYIYFLLHLVSVYRHTLEDIKELILECNTEYDGVDNICGERWGIWDLVPWSEDNGIGFEAVSPTYDRQKEAFSELHIAMSEGRFKTPDIPVPGSESENILKEELKKFMHNLDKKWFGSPEKNEKKGVQDDALYSLAWGIWGGRRLGVQDFRPRGKELWFGTFVRENSARV